MPLLYSSRVAGGKVKITQIVLDTSKHMPLELTVQQGTERRGRHRQPFCIAGLTACQAQSNQTAKSRKKKQYQKV
jgi:hypothetical protein